MKSICFMLIVFLLMPQVVNGAVERIFYGEITNHCRSIFEFIQYYFLNYCHGKHNVKTYTLLDLVLLPKEDFNNISLEHIEQIINNGAQVNQCGKKGSLLKILLDYYGSYSPIRCSHIIELLVKKKADIYHVVPSWYYMKCAILPDYYYGLCWFLLYKNHYQLIEYLMNVPKIKEEFLTNPVYMLKACHAGFDDIIKILLQYGFDIEKSLYSDSFIRSAQDNNRIIDILLQNGAPLILEDTYAIDSFTDSLSEKVYFFEQFDKKRNRINWLYTKFASLDQSMKLLFFERLHYQPNTGFLDIMYGEYEQYNREELAVLLKKGEFLRKHVLKKNGYPLGLDDYRNKKQLRDFQLYDCWIKYIQCKN